MLSLNPSGTGVCNNFIHLSSVSNRFDVFESNRKVQVGKDQEKAQSEKDSHSKNQGGKKPN